MGKLLTVGSLTAREGEKVQGMVEIPGGSIQLPVTLVNGTRPGKTLLITSGVHGGEYVGIQAAIETAASLQPEEVQGQVILVHPANPNAFYQRVSYINPGDGKNLNRSFPGDPNGTQTERMAHFIATQMVDQADFCVDLHGGDLHEELSSYAIYSDASTPENMAVSLEAARQLTVRYIHKSAATGGLYGCSALRGIPGILIERGCRGLWTPQEVADYREDLCRLMRHLGILPGTNAPAPSPVEFQYSKVLRAPKDGCWYPMASPGDWIAPGQKLGELRDCFGNLLFEAVAQEEGMLLYRIVSLAVNEGSPLCSYVLL